MKQTLAPYHYAIIVSSVIHLGLLAAYLLLPTEQAGSKTSTTIQVTLNSMGAGMQAIPGSSSIKGGYEALDTADENSKDLIESAQPWRNSTTVDSFQHVKGLHAGKPALSWVSGFFKTSQTLQPNTSGNSSRAEAEQLLMQSPSTRSSFWPYLVRHLASNKYHDKQFPYSTLTEEHIVILELGFEPNGMLVKAEIAKSSGDDSLDDAAIRSAYAANPYSPPPQKDRFFGYNYLVQIIYTPGTSRG